MEIDLHALAASATAEIERIAEMFPPQDPAREALRAAVWKIRLFHVWGTPQKSRIVLLAVRRGYRRIADLAAVTGIDRRELCDLLDRLVDRGYLTEGREPSIGGRGRPFRIFELSEKGDAGFSDGLIAKKQ